MKTNQRGNQKRDWCFTVNNPFDNKEIYMNALEEHCTYIVIGDEVGELGTPHLQGYLQLKKKLRLHNVRELFPSESPPHLEGRKGTKLQAADYCKKEAHFIEFGSLENMQGERTDLDGMTGMLVDNASMRDVALSNPATWVRNYRGLAAFQALIAPPPRIYREHLECHLYYGKTGTGKSYKALFENPGIFRKPVGKGLWFDGIPWGCKSVLLEEVTGQYPLSDMLMLMDKYQIQVETKGGHAFLDVDKIVMTTNVHPATWYDFYKNREEQGLALFRRFTKIFWFRTRDDVREIGDEPIEGTMMPAREYFFSNYVAYM